MAEPLEVNYQELKHLVSERALKGETVLLNMGPAAPKHAWGVAPVARAGW